MERSVVKKRVIEDLGAALKEPGISDRVRAVDMEAGSLTSWASSLAMAAVPDTSKVPGIGTVQMQRKFAWDRALAPHLDVLRAETLDAHAVKDAVDAVVTLMHRWIMETTT